MTATAPSRTLRTLITAALCAGLAFGLAACGKKGSPKPPEGEEAQYTYPHDYPAPSTVTPGAADTPGQGGDPFWIFTPDDEKRTKTKTY